MSKHQVVAANRVDSPRIIPLCALLVGLLGLFALPSCHRTGIEKVTEAQKVAKEEGDKVEALKAEEVAVKGQLAAVNAKLDAMKAEVAAEKTDPQAMSQSAIAEEIQKLAALKTEMEQFSKRMEAAKSSN